ncbi:MAG: PASTA domain-containing protein, partial [Clostridia bacterium]|nr:PASTA domain-containing protein [Clostridia bacterium]
TVEGNKAIGSVHYISPEQARGEITDEKTDLYSVGIMLYETLTGRLPFEADNAVSVAIMQMQSEATAPHLINEEIPEGLEQITLKAMQKDTAKRYQSAAEMLSDFDEFKRNPSIKFEYTYMVDETPTRYVDAITRVRGESPEPKAKKDETVTTKKSNKKNISLVVILLVVTLLAVGGMVWFVFWLINGGLNKDAEEIKVEKFIGMSYIEEIKNNSAYSGKYKFNVIEEDANDPSRDVGEVFKQSPAFGSTVKKGATITLYVNNDTPDDVTLDIKTVVVGKHRDEVRKLLQDAGLRVQEKLASHDSIAKDHVIEVDIEMGKSYPYGKLVTVTVSSGVSKLEPIGFPPVLGYDSKEAMDFLKDEGFVGIIDVKEENYTGDTLVEQGVVMAIAVGGVRQETLPEKLAPDAGITLIVSSGLKNAEFELDWPQVINPTMMIDVRVKINGRVNTEFSQKFVGITVQDTIDKFAFTVTSHPTRVSYLFVVEVKKHGDSDDNYYVYTRLRIDPVTGAVMEELPYQHIPGITPEPIQMVAIPSDFYVAGMPADVAKNTLSGLGFVVVEQIETNEDWTEGTAVRIERDGVTLYPGQELEKGSTIVLVISSGSAQGGTDPTDPPFNPEFPVM